MRTCIFLGLLLTIVGIALGASALITNHRRQSGKPLFPRAERLKRWISMTGLRRHRAAVVAGAGAAQGVGVVQTAEAFVIPAPDAPMERQIEYLRGQVESLRNKIGEERISRQDALTQASEELRTTDAFLDNRIRGLDEKMADLAAGSTWRQLWGLIFVGLGSALMALPALLKWQ